MTALSTAPAGAVAQAGEYLRHGDVDNVEQLLRFLADTFLLEGYGFDAAARGRRPRRLRARPRRRDDRGGARRPRPGPADGRRLLLPLAPAHRQHRLRRRPLRRDRARRRERAAGVELHAAPRRATAASPRSTLLDGHVDALITTMLATGGSGAADTTAPSARASARLAGVGRDARSRRSTCR